MRMLKSALALSTFVALAACGSEDAKAPSAEMALLADLQTELAMERADSQKVISALELGKTAEPETKEAPAVAPQAAAPRQSTARRSTSSASRSSTSSSSSGSVASAPARQPRVVEVKHTKRDAAIGAAAGAAIGAVAGGSNNRVKGAIIGAAAGGIAGAVIGSTVDKSTRVEY